MEQAAQTNESPGTAPDFEAIRTDQYAYGEYQSTELEFYDLLTDPFQETSLHDSTDPNLQQIMSDLQQKHATLRTCAGDSCLLTSAPVKGSPIAASSTPGAASKPLPMDFRVAQNFPDPFSPETQIRSQLPQLSRVAIRIFNTLGQLIRTLVDREYEPGYHTLSWDGKDHNGSPVSSSIYFSLFEAGAFSRVVKMSLVR